MGEFYIRDPDDILRIQAGYACKDHLNDAGGFKEDKTYRRGQPMKTRRMVAAAMAVMIALSMASTLCAEEKHLKIGLMAPVSGPNPDWGKKQIIGLEMALENIIRRGGVMGTPLEVVVRDTGGNGDQAVAVYRELAGPNGVLAVIGPLFTTEFMAVMSETNDLKTAIIATASARPGLSDLEKRPYAFRMTVTSDKKEAPAAKAWVAAHGIKNVVITYVQDDPVWGPVGETLWPEIMAGLNVDILNRADPISFPTGQENFQAYVQKIAGYGPDGICIAALSMEAGRLLREIRRQGLSQPILGASGTANPKVIEVAGKAAEGFWSTSLFYSEDPNPRVRAYIREFRTRCQERFPEMNCDPEQYDLVVYDSLHFLADIMKRKGISGMPQRLGEERDKIRVGLAAMGVWRGTAGMMSFDEKGDGIRTVHILTVRNGKWQRDW